MPETTPTATDRPTLEKAIGSHDAIGLAQASGIDELTRLKTAEEVLALARDRKKNTGRLALFSQLAVGGVAVIGMLVNAYQSFASKQQQLHQAQVDQERWSKEFVRAQRADKYRAFFETSVLATDPANADKRLVGYALMQEFVDDEDYNTKATLMLEESLMQELRGDTKEGLDDAHRNAVVAIVSALSQSSDCKALERAARSIDKIAKHHAKSNDLEETTEVFRIYVRRLVGHSALACKSMKELSQVRRPLLDTLMHLPELGGLPVKPKEVDASTRLAEILADSCHEELKISGVSECPAIFDHYAKLCAEAKSADKSETAACEVIRNATPMTAPAAPPPPPQPE